MTTDPRAWGNIAVPMTTDPRAWESIAALSGSIRRHYGVARNG